MKTKEFDHCLVTEGHGRGMLYFNKLLTHSQMDEFILLEFQNYLFGVWKVTWRLCFCLDQNMPSTCMKNSSPLRLHVSWQGSTFSSF